MNDYQKKGTISLDVIKKDLNKDFNNILYGKSYIVDGHGKAVVCAVGAKSQYGMPHVEIEEKTLKEVMTPIRYMLEKHMMKVLRFTYRFAYFIMFQYFLQKIFFPPKVDFGAKSNIAETL